MLKNGDFIKVEYDGFDDKGNKFDSTNGEVAKTLHGKEGPLLIVVGKHRLIRGLEDSLKDMKKGEQKEILCSPEKAFGPRMKELVKIMNENDFLRNKIMPQPGLTVHVDTEEGRLYGTIKSVNSGRILVDFNHPLAGKSVKYVAKITEVLETDEAKVKAIAEEVQTDATFALEKEKVIFSISKKEEHIEEKKAMLLTLIKGLMPHIKTIDFKETD